MSGNFYLSCTDVDKEECGINFHWVERVYIQ